jgi:hypothetical protein
LRAGSTQRINDAVFTALHPDARALANPPSDINALSSPLLLEWFDVRILLGADLLTNYWSSAEAAGGNLTTAVMTKVPHHGSTTALAGEWSSVTSDTAIWFVTPFNKGQKLPNFAAGEGLERMLGSVREVHLTALGRRPSGPVASDRRMSLSEARLALQDPIRRGIAFRKPSTSTLATSWVAAAFEPSGALVGKVRRGQSALTVLRD